MDTLTTTENEDYEIPKAGPKTAMVSIIGRPSAGKSTFLNTASGETISIVSEIPQTTRNAIKGIVNTSLGQLVFIDTHGLHISDKKLNLKLFFTFLIQHENTVKKNSLLQKWLPLFLTNWLLQ